MKRLDVLLVIDLQPGFVSSEDASVVRAARGLAEAAAKRGDLCVLVEFNGQGKTFPSIVKACPQLPVVVTKYSNDGSDEIASRLQEEGVLPASFSLSGVNTPWCVLQTAQGLAAKFPDVSVKVLLDACDDFSTSKTRYPEASHSAMQHASTRHKNLMLA